MHGVGIDLLEISDAVVPGCFIDVVARSQFRAYRQDELCDYRRDKPVPERGR